MAGSKAVLQQHVRARRLRAVSGQLKRTMADLLARGVVGFTIPEKPGSRHQKYRLTE